jgi:hypothetical protein
VVHKDPHYQHCWQASFRYMLFYKRVDLFLQCLVRHGVLARRWRRARLLLPLMLEWCLVELMDG